MVWKPHVTVAAVVCRDERYLVVKEHIDGNVVINQPAGHLEPEETLVQAVQREVLEETAWSFEPRFLIGIYLLRRPEPDITYLRFCFGGDCTKFHTERSLDDDIIETSWMTIRELHDSKSSMRSPLVLRCVEDLMAGHAHPLQMLNYWPEMFDMGETS